MKLRERLGKCDPEQIVAIGSKSGSGFLYIGEAGNLPDISKAYDNHLSSRKRALKLQEHAIVNLVKSIDDVETAEDVMNKASKIYHKYSGYLELKKYIKSYKPVMERSAVNIYERESEPCLNVMVSGTEHGQFWTKDEYDKANRRRK